MRFFGIDIVAFVFCISQAGAQDNLKDLEQLARSDPKPFVIIEGSGKTSTNRSQGVIVSSKGHVLSAGHVAWIDSDKAFTDRFRISFRGTGNGLPEGFDQIHKATFIDREDTTFSEHYFHAKLQKQGDTRFIAKGDLAIFQIDAPGDYPKVDFFSKDKPELTMGDTLHLCHYSFPHKAGNPLFLINPVEVVGVAQTSSGIQYLAKGYYRVGSSGGAILKNGRLIGIQSSAYTVNAKKGGEIPMGLISFELVWSDMLEEALAPKVDSADQKEEQDTNNQLPARAESKPE